jgi:tetratricopeptide (TPR) repeat protein
MSSENGMAKVLLELEKFSLIRWDRTYRLISIHRLVQLVVGDGMTNEEKISAVNGFIKLCGKAFPTEVTNESRPLCRKYQSQVVEPLLRLGVLKSADLSVVKGQVGDFLLRDGKYGDGEKFLLEAHEIASTIFKKTDYASLQLKMRLAIAFFQFGRDTEAAEMLEDVLKLRKKVLSKNHPETLATTHELALVYIHLGQNERATKLLKHVVKKCETNAFALRARYNLAVLYDSGGQQSNAKKLFHEVFRRLEIEGDDGERSLGDMFLLVRVYNRQGQFARATELLEKNIAKTRTIIGDEHPATIYLMITLAEQYRTIGDVDQATSLDSEISRLKERMSSDQLWLNKSGSRRVSVIS